MLLLVDVLKGRPALVRLWSDVGRVQARLVAAAAAVAGPRVLRSRVHQTPILVFQFLNLCSVVTKCNIAISV